LDVGTNNLRLGWDRLDGETRYAVTSENNVHAGCEHVRGEIGKVRERVRWTRK
jgi:hypothetical protein